MKKRIIIVGIILIFIVAVLCGMYLYSKGLFVTKDKVTITKYDIRTISQKDAQKINSCKWNDIDGDGTTYSRPGQLSYAMNKTSNTDYGNIFEVTYNFKCKRLSKMNDYYVTPEIDTSALSKDEQIFFYTMYPYPDQQNFYDDMDINYWVVLNGCTFDYSKDQIAEICSKIKIKLNFEDSNGNIKKHSYSYNTDEMQYEELDKDEQEDDIRYLGLD